MTPKKTETRGERISVAVSQSTLKTIEAYAEAHGQSVSAAVGDFLEDADMLLRAATKMRVANNEKKKRMMEKALRGKLI